MNLSEDDLRQIIAENAVGDAWPYRDGSGEDIEGYLKRVVADLGRAPLIRVEADFGHYGSGYASYVDVFCDKRDGSSTTRRDDVVCIEGISVYLCRLAPVAVYGRNERTKRGSSGSYGFISSYEIGTTPPGEWEEFRAQVCSNLTAFGFEFPDKQWLCMPLPFEAEIPTILNNGGYLVYDALFYWED